MINNQEQGDSLLGLRTDTYTADGKIHFYANSAECDFSVTAKPDYCPKVMRGLLEVLRRLGLELMDEGECEPEILDDDSIRLYLVPIVTNPPHKELILRGRILLPFTLPDLVDRIPLRQEVAA